MPPPVAWGIGFVITMMIFVQGAFDDSDNIPGGGFVVFPLVAAGFWPFVLVFALVQFAVDVATGRAFEK